MKVGLKIKNYLDYNDVKIKLFFMKLQKYRGVLCVGPSRGYHGSY